MHRIANSCRILVLLFVFVSRASAQQATNPSPPPMPAINPADIDTTCKPCENFFKFATGGWAKRTPIPAAFASWSSFNELGERNNELLRRILETAAREAPTTKDADQRRVGRFYATCMDTVAIEARRASPIQAQLDRIERISTRKALIDEIVAMHGRGFPMGFNAFSTQDDKDSRRMILALTQGGLGLPDRDYYYKTDSATAALRAAYQQHIAAMLKLVGSHTGAGGSTVTQAGGADFDAQAARVVALETALAEHSLNRVQQRDPKAQYHLMSVADADKLTPGWSWKPYLSALGLARVDSMNVAHPAFFTAFAKELETRPIDDWKAYLRFRLTNNAAGWLSSDFGRQAFWFTSKLTGAREQQPRWRRCLNVTDGLLTDPLGREYVKVAFTPQAKAAMDAMIDNLMIVYRRRLESLPWMGDATRQEALKKLGTFKRKIGYPERWRDYSKLDIEPSGWWENFQRAALLSRQQNLAKVGKPVDRSEWGMTPPTVNAYYSASNNEIVFPAGRLQAPFFHPSYDFAANYGGIGATIGHETSHGFDDEGRQYDAEGNLRDWWTADDARRFGELAGAIERQYSAYVVLDSLHINGKQTLGEDLADNAGVSIAYEALQLALKDQPRTLIDGFTPEQRFFLGWAQARRIQWRDQALRLAVSTDVHSPGEFRVNGPLSNMPEFAAAWGCKKGDGMVREVRAGVW